MQRWNPTTGQFEAYSPGERRYPELPPKLLSQFDAIEPSFDGIVHYYPCRVRLRSNLWENCVYLAESSEYIRAWGVWPDEDQGKLEVKIEEVEEIQESPLRLPLRFARVLYKAGESGMGYTLFALRYEDSSVSYHLAGNAIDFIALPDGKSIKNVATVLPHHGRDQTNLVRSPKYSWCLFTKT